MAEFLDWYASLIDSGAMPQASEMSQLFTVGPEESLMGQGRAAMMIAPSSGLSGFSAASGDNLRLVKIPGETSESCKGTMVNVGIFYGISANTQHPAEAGKFVDFMINDPDAGKILGLDRGVPLSEAVVAAISPDLNELDQQQVAYMSSDQTLAKFSVLTAGCH